MGGPSGAPCRGVAWGSCSLLLALLLAWLSSPAEAPEKKNRRGPTKRFFF